MIKWEEIPDPDHGYSEATKYVATFAGDNNMSREVEVVNTGSFRAGNERWKIFFYCFDDGFNVTREFYSSFGGSSTAKEAAELFANKIF